MADRPEPDQIRRSTLSRAPMVRSVFLPATPWRMPRWLRWLLLALLLLALLLWGLYSCRDQRGPDSSAGGSSLSGMGLAGPRLVAGPICIDEAVDVSSSMDQYRLQRERAERELFAFAHRELGDDDLFAEVFFATSAVSALPPSQVKLLNAAPGIPLGIDYTGTELAPAVDALVAARTPGDNRCAARALVVITDGAIDDNQEVLATALLAGGYTRIFAVVPAAAGSDRPQRLTGDVVDTITVYHFYDGQAGAGEPTPTGAKPLDVIFGEIIASLTGQRLVPTQVPVTTATTP